MLNQANMVNKCVVQTVNVYLYVSKYLVQSINVHLYVCK